jgi:hypothetical protein
MKSRFLAQPQGFQACFISKLGDEKSVVIGHYKSMGCNGVFLIFPVFKTRHG